MEERGERKKRERRNKLYTLPLWIGSLIFGNVICLYSNEPLKTSYEFTNWDVYLLW